MSAIEGSTSWARAGDNAVSQINSALDNSRTKDSLEETEKDRVMRKLALLFAICAGPALGHEFWLQPTAYRVAADGRLTGNIVNGQNFDGVTLPYVPQRFVHFKDFTGDKSIDVPGRAGDTPALDMPALAEGLNVLAYHARYSTVDYENWEKFAKFAEHKDFGDLLARHQERGLPMEKFKELYARFSKTLIGVGNSEGADRRFGMETEIVALTNPYTDDLSEGMQLQLYYQADVRADSQIEIFEKAPDETVTIFLVRTDAQGIATIPVKSGFSYMADAVVLREPSEEKAEASGAVYETLWANLTFQAP